MEAVADGSKAAAASGVVVETSEAGRRKTKLVKVEQWIINHLLAQPKVMEDASPQGRSLFDALAEVLVDDPEVDEMRAQHADCVAFYRKMNDVNEDILAQYKEKGYAMVEVEVMEDGTERLVY